MNINKNEKRRAGHCSTEELVNLLPGEGLREPIFEPEEFFRAIFRRSPEFALKEGTLRTEAIGENDRVKTTQKTTQKTIQKTAQKIIDIIRKQPEITRQELAAELGITESGIKYQLKKMQEKGLLRRVGPNKGGHWEVISG